MKKVSRAFLYCLALLFVPGTVLANTALPGPIVWQGVVGADSIVRYILAVGLVCVGIEAAIYRYLPRFEHPYRDSIVANSISTVLGIPLAFLGLPFGDIIIIPTLASIISEGTIICFMERSGRMQHGKSIFWPVFWSNILSNAMIFGLLIWKLE